MEGEVTFSKLVGGSLQTKSIYLLVLKKNNQVFKIEEIPQNLDKRDWLKYYWFLENKNMTV